MKISTLIKYQEKYSIMSHSLFYNLFCSLFYNLFHSLSFHNLLITFIALFSLIHSFFYSRTQPLKKSCKIFYNVFRMVSHIIKGHLKTLGTQMDYPIGVLVWLVVEIYDQTIFRLILLSRRCQPDLPTFFIIKLVIF